MRISRNAAASIRFPHDQLSAQRRDARHDRCTRPRADEADRLSDQHRPRADRGRAGALRRLRDRRIAGAALDVFAEEPIRRTSITGAEGNAVAIVAPHSLCWTDECFRRCAESAFGAIADVALGTRPAYPVNPDVNPQRGHLFPLCLECIRRT